MDFLVRAVGFAQQKGQAQAERGGRVMSADSVNFIVAGEGTFQDFRTPETRIGPGSVLMLFAGKWHHFDPDPGTVWDERWIVFDGPATKANFGPIVHTESSLYHFEPDPVLDETHEDLSRAWFYRGLGYEETTHYLLHKFLFELHAKIKGIDYAVQRNEDSLVFSARAAMSYWIRRGGSWDAHRFARERGISYEQFRKRFKKETGYSPGQYYSLLRANRVREQLIRTDMTIRQIAYDLGYDDEYYFSRWFKNQEGVSPRDYRQRHVMYTRHVERLMQTAAD